MPIISYLYVSGAHPGTSRIYIPTCTSLRNLNSDISIEDVLKHDEWATSILRELSIWGGVDHETIINIEGGASDINMNGYEAHNLHVNAAIRILRRTHQKLDYATNVMKHIVVPNFA